MFANRVSFLAASVSLIGACGADARLAGHDAGGSGDTAVTPADAARDASPRADGNSTAPADTGGDTSPARADTGMEAGQTAAGSYPAERLDLTNWKITLPIADPTKSAFSPLEVLQPRLATYSHPIHFHLTAAKDAVVFQAHAGGVTTSNSGYPRSELREMANDGKDNASWSTTTGTHTMTITQTITHLPEVKPHVVAGQIHDSGDDVIMVRLERNKLFVEGGGRDLGTLETNYQLGTRFTVKIVATGGRIRVSYNDVQKVDLAASISSGCYFKAGAYTQSNTSKGDLPTAYGEVIIHDLKVMHQ